MLLVGYFEGIDSQRGIAWRCSDSLALRRFLQLSMTESVPDHSSLTRVRDRLTTAVHEQVFALSATIHPAACASDAKTLVSSLLDAAVNLARAGCTDSISSVTADKAYPSKESLAACDDLGVATYMPGKKAAEKPPAKDAAAVETASPEQASTSASTGSSQSAPPSTGSAETKPPSRRDRLREANKVRSESAEGRRLLRLRSEKVEWSFAHTCRTGGARRTWLRSLEKVAKRYLMTVAARYLGLLMRLLFGIGRPRAMQGIGGAFRRLFAVFTTLRVWLAAPSARSVLPTLRFHIRLTTAR